MERVSFSLSSRGGKFIWLVGGGIWKAPAQRGLCSVVDDLKRRLARRVVLWFAYLPRHIHTKSFPLVAANAICTADTPKPYDTFRFGIGANIIKQIGMELNIQPISLEADGSFRFLA